MQIEPTKEVFRIWIENHEYTIPRDSTSMSLFALICPYIDEVNLQKEMLLPRILIQYHHSIRVAVLLKARLLTYSNQEGTPYSKELEEILQLVWEWNIFLQDVLRRLKIDLSNEAYFK